MELGLGMDTFNPTTWEAEACRSLIKASLVYRVPEQQGRVTRETLFVCSKMRERKREREYIIFSDGKWEVNLPQAKL